MNLSSISRGAAAINSAAAGCVALMCARNFGASWSGAILASGVAGAAVLMMGSKSRHSLLQVADLRGANLTEANLTGANCNGTSFLFTNFKGATVDSEDLKGSFLIHPDLTGTSLGPENLTRSIISFAPIDDNFNKSWDLLRKIHETKTTHAREKDKCPISLDSGNEIKDPIYIKKSNGDYDCYDREQLKAWVREGIALGQQFLT
ncbi:pentapeptide repeat-containing protein [Piscirickettsia salmonis]|uniref:pentapeptide repeat-containing protein n=1 Tax=Piscirickettsia salmonis TaxID=1238 RepID=UPI0012BADF14|nr:pentapeptide repeat-containing protein [Piscirickettsia salmonis]